MPPDPNARAEAINRRYRASFGLADERWMARVLDTTLFIKNGPCMAGLGLGGEGYLSYSIATPTGEGVTNPKTFCRVRRCVMVDNLRIY